MADAAIRETGGGQAAEAACTALMMAAEISGVDERLAAHCDYLHVTVPYEESGGLLEDILDACGDAGVYEKRGDVEGVWRVGHDEGTVLAKRRGPVMVYGFSGATVRALRNRGRCWPDLLATLGARPHRVTKLDAAYDLRVDAPPILWDLYQRGKLRGLRLGRAASEVQLLHWRPGSTGVDTGTVAIGTRKAELRAKVYDKRQERIDAKDPDPGPWLRYEITVTDSHGISLEDAMDATSVFWHFACPALLRPPAGCDPPEWVPKGSGFKCAPREPRTAVERLERFMETSRIIPTLRGFATACGAYGPKLVMLKLEEALNVGGEGGPPPSEAVAPSSTADRLPGAAPPTYAAFRRAREADGW